LNAAKHLAHRPPAGAGQPVRAFRAAGVLVAVAGGIFVVGLLVGFLVIGRHGGGPIQGWDNTVERWYVHHRGSLVGVSKFVATYLDAGPLAVICVVLSAVLVIWLRSIRGLIPIVAYLGGEFQVFAIRILILRHRPPTAVYPAPGAVKGVHETSYSFPSGHSVAVTAVLFALLGAVALHYRTWWPWLVALVGSLFVINTRLVLGVHWFSDVTFGCAFGIVWGVTVAHVARRVEWSDVVAIARPAARGPRSAGGAPGVQGREASTNSG
jgi:membrane-associated phospholipid phosphatase